MRTLCEKIVLTVLMVSLAGISHGATAATGSSQNGSDTMATHGPKKQIATILFAGLAGATLGLSTLSFYGRPQDKLSNIAVGFAVGVIVGTGYTAFVAATRPRNFYDGAVRDPSAKDTEMWQQLSQASKLASEPAHTTPSLDLSWDF